MRPPLLNLGITLSGSALIFSGMALHPSLVLIALGGVMAFLGIALRFECVSRPRQL
jgi:hypothetical protein